MATNGRTITINNGGKLVFQELGALGMFTGTITLNGGNLTGNRTYTLPDQDCVLGGLAPGEVWSADLGGTGLHGAAKDCIPVGSGGPAMYLTNAPQNHMDMLFFDKIVTNKWQSAPMDLSGIEATTARNLTTTFGPYSSKLGSELRFKGFAVSGNLLSISESNTQITIGLNLGVINIPSSQITDNIDLTNKVTGVLPVGNGGTGLNSVSDKQMLVGNAQGGYKVIPAPTSSGQYLRSNADNTGLSWQNVTLVEPFTGEIVSPIARTYNLSNNWGYNAKIDSVTIKTITGTASFNFFAANRIAGTGNVTTTKQILQIGGVALNAGDDFTLTLSNLAGCSGIAFTVNMTRL